MLVTKKQKNLLDCDETKVKHLDLRVICEVNDHWQVCRRLTNTCTMVWLHWNNKQHRNKVSWTPHQTTESESTGVVSRNLFAC